MNWMVGVKTWEHQSKVPNMYHCYNIEKDWSLKSIHLELPQSIIFIVNDQEASYSFVIGYFLHLGGQE